MTDDAPRTLQVVRGEPSPDELAVLTALVAVAGSAEPRPAPAVARGTWSDPAAGLRHPHLPGPGGWRAAARP